MNNCIRCKHSRKYYNDIKVSGGLSHGYNPVWKCKLKKINKNDTCKFFEYTLFQKLINRIF